jgi:hypothetical protein
MLRSVSRDHLQIIIHEARHAARRLQRHLCLSHCDLEDIRQDLVTDLLSRMPRFDPERGPLGAFAGLVMANRGSRLAASIYQRRRRAGPLSLDHPLSTDDATTFGDTIAESDGYLAMMGLSTDLVASIELRFDLIKLLGALEQQDRQLCIALIDSSPTNLTRPGTGSRATIYRRLQKIRKQLIGYGLTETVRRFSGGRVVPFMGIAPTGLLQRAPPSVAKFYEWLSAAAPGDTLEYFHGFLSVDTSPCSGSLPEAQRLELVRVAHQAWLASQRGHVHLLQRRIGDNSFAYLAVARPQMRPSRLYAGREMKWPDLATHGAQHHT